MAGKFRVFSCAALVTCFCLAPQGAGADEIQNYSTGLQAIEENQAGVGRELFHMFQTHARPAEMGAGIFRPTRR